MPTGAIDPAARRVRGDFLNQLLFVGDAARRLMALQDRDPRSPSFGSFHCAYWRDKTSEFADARFQEAGAALGLLAHPCFEAHRAARGWPGAEELNEACHAGLLNLQRLQYPEGSYDEWYKGERGFAATAFTTFAYAAAAIFLGRLLPERTRSLALATLTPAAGWLARREDLVKVNHEVVAAAALAAFSKISGETKWLDAAAAKMGKSLETQTEEGWFPELRGMDFGYSALVLDYAMLYHRLSGDARTLAPAAKLTAFLLPHLHPDITLSGEGGTCRNAYAGQCGYVLLAPRDTAAAAITGALAGLDGSEARIYPYLGDDLRLARWSLLPLLGALLFAGGDETPPDEGELPYPQGWTVHRRAAVAAYHQGRLHVYVPYAGGAVTRVYLGRERVVSDLGLDVHAGKESYTSLAYSTERPVSLSGTTLRIGVELTQPKYLFPPFRQRLLLRLGSLTAASARLTRAAIDRYRLKARTAINQSSASVSRGGSGLLLSRSIAVGEDRVTITDSLKGVPGMVVEPRLRAMNERAGGSRLSVAGADLTIGKTLDVTRRTLEQHTS